MLFAADAIAACRSTPDRFDAVIASPTSSAPDGLLVARALRECMSRQPILPATVSTIEVSIDVLMDAGILKSCDGAWSAPNLPQRWRAACVRRARYRCSAIPDNFE